MELPFLGEYLWFHFVNRVSCAPLGSVFLGIIKCVEWHLSYSPEMSLVFDLGFLKYCSTLFIDIFPARKWIIWIPQCHYSSLNLCIAFSTLGQASSMFWGERDDKPRCIIFISPGEWIGCCWTIKKGNSNNVLGGEKKAAKVGQFFAK